MNLLQARLMHVLMGMFGPVLVSVRVFVLHMVVLVGRVRMGMRHVAVLVFVRVWRVVGVLFAHWCSLLCEIPCGYCSLSALRRRFGGRDGWPTAFSPLSPRW